MDLHFTDEQIMMRNMVRDFAREEITPFVEKMEEGEFPREILKKMGFQKEAYFRENYFYNGDFLDSEIYSLLKSGFKYNKL